LNDRSASIALPSHISQHGHSFSQNNFSANDRGSEIDNLSAANDPSAIPETFSINDRSMASSFKGYSTFD
jgi:hypothetical protein